MSYNDDDKLKEHNIIQKIKKSGHDISNLNLTYIKGYAADSPIKDCMRLFTTLNFDVSVDIPKDKIIHVEEVPKDKMEFGGTCVWVTKDTELTYTKIERSKIEAQFLEGKIMENYLPFAKDLRSMTGQEFMGLITIIDTLIPTGLCSRWCPSLFVCPLK